MPNETTDPDDQDASDRELSGPDGPAEARTDDTEEIIEQEVLNSVADDETFADQAIAEVANAVDDEERVAGSPISTDALFELLAAPGNRFVLTYLLRADNPTTYADLVDYVVERAAVPADTTAAKFRGRVAARLVHDTLPTLEDAGLIEHDTDEQTVAATPAIEVVAPHLALAMSQSLSGETSD